MSLGLIRGALAGAAGTTALNATTYLDMAVRGRGASSTPQDLVEAAADRVDVTIPGRRDERDNRLAGLGPLAGTGTGVVVGAAAGLVGRAMCRMRRSIPAPVAVLAITVAAMALSDVPLKLLGISDPGEWTAKDWAADLGPHLVYGIVTYSALRAMEEDQ